MNSILKYKLDYLLIVLLSFPILFLKLGSFSLRLWDESIYATNSIEMMERGEWIVPYYNGEMDYWNTKPPFIHWVQIISMKIFGINELAVRLPSAFAGLACVFIVYYFLKKYKNVFTGFISALILLTTVGFISFHGARTGDTDVFLALFILIMVITVFAILINNSFSNRQIIIFFSALIAAFLTKSYAALIILPPIVLFLFLYKKLLLISILKSKAFWIGAFSFLFISIGFIFIRDALQPGYASLMVTNDAGLLTKDFGKHQQPLFFYLDNLFSFRLFFWSPFLILSILLFVKEIKSEMSSVINLSFFIILFYFILLSLSNTKLAWYDIPLFPILAVNIALLFNVIFEKISFTSSKIIFVFLILFIIPYKHVFGLSQTNHFVEYEMKNEVRERFLFNYFNTGPGEILNGKTKTKMVVYNNRYDRSLRFYQSKFKTTQLELIITDRPDLKSGDLFLIEDEYMNEDICTIDRLEVIEKFENLNIYKVK